MAKKVIGADGPLDRESTRFRIPKQIEIAGTMWNVTVRPQWDPGVLGHSDFANREIRIRDGLAPAAAVEVFMHELLHSCVSAFGVHGVDPEDEERMVNALAPALLDVFRRNRFRFA